MPNPHPASSLFTQVDITPSSANGEHSQPVAAGDENTVILRQVLSAQDRQNELLEELVNLMGSAQRQRQNELGQWKQANPELAKTCRKAAETLSKVQIEFLDKLTEEVNDNAEILMDGEFMFAEFVDRFGPRLAHLNGVLQVLSQLGVSPNPPKNSAKKA